MIKNTLALSSFLALFLLVACSGTQKTVIENAQYWQRKSVSETTYLRGEKAQQMLNRDIARCVTELRELERLGQIKNAIPTQNNSRVLDMDELELEQSDNPERDGNLLMEQSEYHDFHSCMSTKGWERTEYIPYRVQKRAAGNYYSNHTQYKENHVDRMRKDAKKRTENKKKNDTEGTIND